MRRHIALAAVLAFITWARPAGAQLQSDCDSNSTHFEWGTVHVVVSASGGHGVALSAFTSHVLYGGSQHTYFGRFDPDSMENWLAAAHRIATLSGRPDSSVAMLATPRLLALDSSYIEVRRNVTKGRWAGGVALVMVTARDSAGFSILAPHKDADSLLRALFGQALNSRLMPRPDSGAQEDPIQAMQLTVPPRTLGGARLGMPNFGYRLPYSGETIAEFVVDTSGQVEPGTFCAIASDGPIFTAWAAEGVASEKFSPGILKGRPVRVMVMQTVSFHAPR